jgi:cytidylate kinase
VTDAAGAGSVRRVAVVAIDGPSGSGKSSVARAVAAALGFLYLDTGAMYRAVGILARDAGVSPDDDAAVTALAAGADLRFDADGRLQAGHRDLSVDIRTLEAGELASRVSVLPGVRRVLVDHQRALASERGVVMEGRDIGTNVFPGASVKVYLTASPEVRADRRFRELRAAGSAVSYAEVLANVVERDRRDSERVVAPLRQADDAVLVDTTTMAFDEVVAAVAAIARERLRSRGAGGA